MKKPTVTPGEAIKKSGRLEAEPDLFDAATVKQDSTATVTFSGTDNPREQRALAELLVGPVPRERLDWVAGCSNGPALVASLRRKGLGKDGLRCTMVPRHDRDGKRVLSGVYHLSKSGRRALQASFGRENKSRGNLAAYLAAPTQMSLLPSAYGT